MNSVHSNPKKVLTALFAITICLASINLGLLLFSDFNAGVSTGLPALFNMNTEVSIPTWYSQILLFLASGLLFVCGYAHVVSRKYWYGLAGIFLFLSIDEGAAIHELLTAPVRQSLHITSGFLYYSWFIVYGVVLLALAVGFWRFFVSLPISLKKYLCTAAFIFLAGAIGCEAVGASIAASSGETSNLYSMITIAEETLEMLGVSVLIYGLLHYLRDTKYRLDVKF